MDAQEYSATSRFERASDTSWSSLGDEVLVLDLAKRRSHRLTGVAADIWNLASEGKSFQEMHEFLLSNFEVESTQAESDLRETLSLLCDEKVLQELAA